MMYKAQDSKTAEYKVIVMDEVTFIQNLCLLNVCLKTHR
jgi:hypothetical protein